MEESIGPDPNSTLTSRMLSRHLWQPYHFTFQRSLCRSRPAICFEIQGRLKPFAAHLHCGTCLTHNYQDRLAFNRWAEMFVRGVEPQALPRSCITWLTNIWHFIHSPSPPGGTRTPIASASSRNRLDIQLSHRRTRGANFTYMILSLLGGHSFCTTF